MNIEKLKKYAKEESLEKLFGIPSYNENAESDARDHSRSAENYDSDSISSMSDTCDEASSNFDEVISDIESIEYSLESWRQLAIDIWEDLDKDDQEHYISMHDMSSKQKTNVRDAFKLEDLNKL